MTTLDELLVEVGIDADELGTGVTGVADEVERALAGIADAADQVAQEVAAATGRTETDLDGVGDAAEQAARDVEQAADQAADALDGIGDSAEQAARDADQAAGDVGGAFQGLALGAAGAAVGATFMTGLTSAMDMKSATAKLSNQLGLTAEESERAGTIAGDLYTEGFGESIGQVNEALAGVSRNIAGLGTLTDEQVTEMSSGVLALAETFDQDLGQVSRAVGQLMKTGMAKDATEAMDIVTAGLRKGADQGGDFLDTLVGGADNLSSFGFTGQQATGLIVQGLAAGAESAESVTGLFEELVGNVSAGGDDLAETFKELGLNGEQMAKDLTSGGPAANAALDKLLDSIRALEDPIKQDAMMAALFGEEGAAMQNTLLAIDPSSAVTALGDFAGATKDVTDRVTESKDLDTVWRELSTTLGEMFLPYLAEFSDWASENPELLQTIIIGMLTFAVTLGIVAAAQWVWNSAMLAWPGTWIIAAILAVIAAVVLVIVYWDEIKKATVETWNAITKALAEAWAWVTETSSKTWDAVAEGVAAAWDWVTRVTVETWAAITKGLAEAWNWTVKASSEVWNAVAKVFSDGWNWMVKNVFSPIGTFFTVTIPGWVRSGVDGVKALWDDLVSWFAGIPGRLAAIGSSLWGFITNGLKASLNGALFLVNKGIEFINNVLIGNANRIPGVSIGYIPYIPYLAEGGVTTGPTLAMIGEGREQEAVLPLSVLDGMLQSVARPVVQVGAGGPQEVRVVLDVTGGENEFVRFFKHIVDTKAAGSVVRLGEG
ncbi:phage tail tape measure protein [Streptomyces roseolus]|uniref:phage tail tape measure protein n=1 Tax=Streptomyces roseolus TaxID=67358 RepID=UPI00379E8486